MNEKDPILTLNLDETQLVDMLDQGMPARNLSLGFLSDERLLELSRKSNISCAEALLAGRRSLAEFADENANVFLDELQVRREQAAKPASRAGFIGRLLARR